MDDLGNRDSVNLHDGTDEDYVIDANTNRYAKVGDANLANEYTKVCSTNVSYDDAGNLTQDKNSYKYSYDYENRITKVQKSDDTVVAEYTYDALGHRIEFINSSDISESGNPPPATTKQYYYDGQRVAMETKTPSDVSERHFVYGNYIDEVLFMNYGGGYYTCRYYIHDHLFSPVALIWYSTGIVQERYEYDSYGKPTIWNANLSGTRSYSTYGNYFLFTGRETDILDNGSLKTQYNRNRSYSYSTGRWLQRDPIGYVDGMNLYEYVRSSPILNRDPSGLYCGECYPPSDPSKNFYNPRIVSIGKGPYVESPWELGDIKLGIQLIELVKNLADLKVLCTDNFEKVLGELIKRISPDKLPGGTEGALRGIRALQGLLNSNWGYYLYAKVKYEECASCISLNPYVWGRCQGKGRWKTRQKIHRCDAGSPTGQVPGKNGCYSPQEISDFFKNALKDCEESAKNHPNNPTEW